MLNMKQGSLCLKFQEPMGVREMRKSKGVLAAWLFGAVAVMVSGASFAAGGDAANGKKIFMEGKGDAMACMGCHGEKADGNDGMGAPRLANLGQAYVIKQLTDFAGDKRTPAGIGAQMPVFAKALSTEDRRDVAAYVSTLEGEVEPSDLKALKDGGQAIGDKAQGQILVKFGVLGKVSACSSCHNYNGRGAAPLFPMIGQQKYVYLVNQLRNWRASPADITGGAIARTNDPAGMMRAVAKNMTDADILNAAAFLSSAARTTMGNSRVPE
jgi:cytochrome c553